MPPSGSRRRARQVLPDPAVGGDPLGDHPGVGAVLQVGGAGGDQPLHVELVGVEQEADHRLRVVGLVADVGQDQHPGPLAAAAGRRPGPCDPTRVPGGRIRIRGPVSGVTPGHCPSSLLALGPCVPGHLGHAHDRTPGSIGPSPTPRWFEVIDSGFDALDRLGLKSVTSSGEKAMTSRPTGMRPPRDRS